MSLLYYSCLKNFIAFMLNSLHMHVATQAQLLVEGYKWLENLEDNSVETVTLVSFEPINFLEGYLLFLILKFIWKCVTCFPCCSLIVLSFGQEKKMILCHTWIFWSHWCWMNYTNLWEMRLGHFCLLWAIYVFFFSWYIIASHPIEPFN